jgi:hypothetical protein
MRANGADLEIGVPRNREPGKGANGPRLIDNAKPL